MRGYQRASTAQIQLPRELEDAEGRKVVCENGKQLGQVIDVLFDDYHRDRIFLEVKSDGRLQLRHHHFLAPVESAALSQDPIRVPMAYEEMVHAPSHDPSQPFSEEYETAVLGFWGTQLTENVEAVRDPLTEHSGESHSMRAEQYDNNPETPHSSS